MKDKENSLKQLAEIQGQLFDLIILFSSDYKEHISSSMLIKNLSDATEKIHEIQLAVATDKQKNSELKNQGPSLQA